MEVVKINGHRLKVYTSIDEMPIVNYQKFNRFLLFETYVGSDSTSLQAHLTTALRLIDTNIEKAKNEILNTINCVQMISNEVSPDVLSFCSLIYSIDDKVVTDYSDENLQEILKQLNLENRKVVLKFRDDVKKKIDEELLAFFPKMFDSVIDKKHLSYLYKFINLQLDEIINDIDNTDEKEHELLNIFSLYNPKVFLGNHSEEIKNIKMFEKTCLAISQNTSLDPKKLTVLQFYSVIDNLNSDNKQLNNGRIKQNKFRA